MTKKRRAAGEKLVRKARSRDSLRDVSKLTERVDGRFRIRSDPPLLLPLRDLPEDAHPKRLDERVREVIALYRSTLADDRRFLLDRYRLIDAAIKVVGVGSVGTRCFVVLFAGRDRHDALFLQVKEADPSVLEAYVEERQY